MRPRGDLNKNYQTMDSETLEKQLVPLLLHEHLKRLMIRASDF
jgi:hypothetical protein